MAAKLSENNQTTRPRIPERYGQYGNWHYQAQGYDNCGDTHGLIGPENR